MRRTARRTSLNLADSCRSPHRSKCCAKEQTRSTRKHTEANMQAGVGILTIRDLRQVVGAAVVRPPWRGAGPDEGAHHGSMLGDVTRWRASRSAARLTQCRHGWGQNQRVVAGKGMAAGIRRTTAKNVRQGSLDGWTSVSNHSTGPSLSLFGPKEISLSPS